MTAWQVYAEYVSAFPSASAAARSLGFHVCTIGEIVRNRQEHVTAQMVQRVREHDPALAERLSPFVRRCPNGHGGRFQICDSQNCEYYADCRQLASDGQPVRCEKGDDVV